MTRTPAHYPEAVNETIKWLETSHHLGHLSWWERFSTTLDLWFYGFRRMEAEYMRAVKTLGDEATRDAAALVGMLCREMIDDPQDLLGKVYQTIGANDKKRFGQFFTPDSVSSAMASMSLCGIGRSMFTKIGGCVISEPCSGAGTMIIQAALHIHSEFGDWGTQRTHFVCNDIDSKCCQMTALQLLWLNLRFPIGKVTITQGDTLRPETQKLFAWFGADTLPKYARIIRRTVKSDSYKPQN